MRSSTPEPEGSPHCEAARMMVRPMGFPTRKTNSSQAASLQESAHRQTTSFNDKDEYGVVLGVFNIRFCFCSNIPAGIQHTTRPGKFIMPLLEMTCCCVTVCQALRIQEQ